MIIQTFIEKKLIEPIIAITAGTEHQVNQLQQDITAVLEGKNHLVVKTKNGLEKIRITDIGFIEVFNDEIAIHLSAQTLMTKGRLYQFKEQLPEESFIQVHKSIILNLNQVAKLDCSFSGNLAASLLWGETVPVSRRFAANLKANLKKMGAQTYEKTT